MVTVQDFSGLPNLDTLDLSNNSLTDESLVSDSLGVSRTSEAVTFCSEMMKILFLLCRTRLVSLYRPCVLC